MDQVSVVMSWRTNGLALPFAFILAIVMFLSVAADAQSSGSAGDGSASPARCFEPSVTSGQVLPEPARKVTPAPNVMGWRFAENRGQWDSQTLFAASRPGAVVRFQHDRIVLRLARDSGEGGQEGVILHLVFEGVSADVTVAGGNRLPGDFNYLTGNDLSRWRTGVPSYDRVIYHDVYPGIDIEWHALDGHLEYDVVADRGAPVDSIVMRWEGNDGISLTADGCMDVSTSLGNLVQTAPVAWCVDGDGSELPCACRFRILEGHRYGFDPEGVTDGLRLTIDPGLDWSTLLGGSAGGESIVAVALGSDGQVTVAGSTGSVDFPVTPGAFDTTYNPHTFFGADVVVTRFNSSGSGLVFSTLLGGAVNDFPIDVAVTSGGETIVGGWTGSIDYPTTPGAFDSSVSWGDVFVTRLNLMGTGLVYSTLIGGTADEICEAMDLDAQGVVTVTGVTYSADFPVTPGAFKALKTGCGPCTEAFVSKLESDGSTLLYSTLLGGAASDSARAMDVDALGFVTVAGMTSPTDFPFTSILDVGGMFVTRLDPTLSSLIYATQLGAADGDNQPYDVAADAQGGAFLTGRTQSDQFMTTPGAFDTTFNGLIDAFVLHLDATGSTLLYSTFLGGAKIDEGHRIEADTAGVVTVGGFTGGVNFPTTPGAFASSPAGNADLFVTRLAPDGSRPWYSTYLGGSGIEPNDGVDLFGMALGAEGEIVVTASTKSADFPTTPGAFDTTPKDFSDGVVVKLDMLPIGAQKYGGSTPGCAGPLAIGVTSMPQLGHRFGLTCTNAPPSSGKGLLALGTSGLASSLQVKGAELWVAPVPSLLLLPMASNASSFSLVETVLPASASLAGAPLFAQFLWPSPCVAAGWSASNALAVTVQP
jgi:hypothetical protein